MADRKKEELTQPTYRHRVEWEVSVGKKTFVLDDNQVNILKNMSLAGKSSIVWFDTFAISIPHISAIEKIKDQYLKGGLVKWENGAETLSYTEISKEEYEKNQKQLAG